MEEQITNTKRINLKSPKYYFNREISLIQFQKRVLAEAANKSHPLLERLKFLSIFSSNLDEFFMIRVAGLKQQVSAGVNYLSYDGKTPQEQLDEIRKRLLPLYEEQAKILNNDLLPALKEEGIFIYRYTDLSEEDRKYTFEYFNSCVLPVLTPLSLDSAHPFPRLVNRSLNIAFLLKEKDNPDVEQKVAFLQLPLVLPRLVPLKKENGFHLVLLEQIIKAYAEILFPGNYVLAINTFRVTRDADVEISEDEAEDLLKEIEEQVKQRSRERAAVRLEVSSSMEEDLLKLIREFLELEPNDVYIHNRPLHLPDFMKLNSIDLPLLKDKPFKPNDLPQFNEHDTNIFEAIAKQDLIVHHPFDSFVNSVLKFIEVASNDDSVVAIKIILYRTGLNSPVVAALKHASEKGKHVTAFVELKARFDEENNITWAKELEHVGVHVVYGILGLKTHCKVAMVVRNETGSLRTYLHLSTGNYNHVTGQLYTDIGYFTANKEFANDVIHLFNYLTGYSSYNNWKRLIVAPQNLLEKIISLINREEELHTPENPGEIIVKMNALAQKDVIQALYKASQKGVKIKLLVRGVCCLKPGLPGISDNIEVRSILGRFLEHSRVFYFKNAGNEELYLSSADWMTRNLQKRVELMFPILDPKLCEYLKNLLNVYWSDNIKSWKLEPNGNYSKIIPKEDDIRISAQHFFLKQTTKRITPTNHRNMNL